jgi:hypothetical protein
MTTDARERGRAMVTSLEEWIVERATFVLPMARDDGRQVDEGAT